MNKCKGNTNNLCRMQIPDKRVQNKYLKYLTEYKMNSRQKGAKQISTEECKANTRHESAKQIPDRRVQKSST